MNVMLNALNGSRRCSCTTPARRQCSGQACDVRGRGLGREGCRYPELVLDRRRTVGINERGEAQQEVRRPRTITKVCKVEVMDAKAHGSDGAARAFLCGPWTARIGGARQRRDPG